jgi:SP family facilitated glucose transporter-like MFS transporter 8
MDEETAETLGWLPLTSLCIYIISYNLGYGTGPWLVMSEVMSKDTNTIFGPFAGSFSWSMAFLITFTFNNITDLIGIGQTFWVLGGFSVVGVLFTFFVIPETKGKSMAYIQKMLENETEKQSE